MSAISTTPAPSPPLEGPLIAGGSRSDAADEPRLVHNPATGEILARVAPASVFDVDRAAKAARAALESTWGKTRPQERARVLHRAAALIREQAGALALLESLNTGKPLASARGEILAGADCFEYYAGAVTKFGGETIPVSAPGACLTFREPVGVCALIVPWNFPFLIACWKLAPALAMGNSALLKPASDTPLTALRLGELLLSAGVPDGAIAVLPGAGESIGTALVKHPLVRRVSFTGSTEAGTAVMRLCADGIKRVSLELGGKSACLVFDDVDLEATVASFLWSALDNAGQDCCARSRILVQRSIHDELVALLTARVKAIRVGDPLATGTEMGPLITPAHREKVKGYLALGEAEGAQRLCGGEAPENPALERGNFLLPAVLTGVRNEMRIAQEEIFGPVVCVIPFEDEADAVRLANASPYGLSGSLYTRDIGRALRVARAVETGVLSVNSARSVFIEAPFGGFKESGFGRELGMEALRSYSELKSVFISES